MVIIGPAAADEVAGGRPFTANAGFACQPANLHCRNYPSDNAGMGIAPTTSLPPFPPSMDTSYGASTSAPSPLPPQQHPPHLWQQLQPTAPASSSIADTGLQTGCDDYFAMLANYSLLPQSAPAPFVHLAMPPPPQQPQVQMQFAAQASYPSYQAMDAPVEAVPLAHAFANDTAPAAPRRGRPRKNPVASIPNRPAPRRKAPAASNSAATSRRQVRRQPAVQATNAVAVTTTSGQAGPCINPTALPGQEQCPLQSTSRDEASMMEEAIESYAVTAARTGDEGANKPAPRRRGRTRKDTVASSPRRPAPRRKASVAKSSAESSLDQDQLQLHSTSKNPCAWEEEASMTEDAMGSYADTTAPGVRFRPNNEEIIGFLRMKYLGRKMTVDFIKDFNVYQAHPETVQASCGESVDGCWYVFSPRKRRYPNGGRPARSVGVVGFWKSNTKETDISVDGAVIGKVTALTFELGHQPDGIQTPWKMKEYCLPEKQHKHDGSNMLLDDWVLCKIFCNSHDDKDPQTALSEEGDELVGVDEDADDETGDEDTQVAAVGQGDQPADAGEAAGETEGYADMQIVPDEQTLSISQEDYLCVDDWIVCDPTLSDQDHAAN